MTTVRDTELHNTKGLFLLTGNRRSLSKLWLYTSSAYLHDKHTRINLRGTAYLGINVCPKELSTPVHIHLHV
jgi:hypothetical protein